MQFRNPQTGYTETKTAPMLWTALFGGLYFLANGLWTPLLLWSACAVVSFAILGEPGTLLVLLVSLIFAAAGPDLIRRSYLRRGWVEVEETGSLAGAVRQCPACAETVKAEAVICRFCQRELPAIEAPAKTNAQQEEAMLVLMDKHDIYFDGFHYHYKKEKYLTFAAALEQARNAPSA
jgi:hypothetical protein